eukprot:13623.XXX_372708_373025_1 [CDS] Oithona nana genome sequencing.
MPQLPKTPLNPPIKMRSLDDRQESLGTCTYIGYKLLCKLDNIFEEVILSSVFKSEKYNSFDIYYHACIKCNLLFMKVFINDNEETKRNKLAGKKIILFILQHDLH